MKTLKLLLAVAGGLVLAVLMLNVVFYFLSNQKPKAAGVEVMTPGGRVAHGADSVRLVRAADSLPL